MTPFEEQETINMDRVVEEEEETQLDRIEKKLASILWDLKYWKEDWKCGVDMKGIEDTLLENSCSYDKEEDMCRAEDAPCAFTPCPKQEEEGRTG